MIDEPASASIVKLWARTRRRISANWLGSPRALRAGPRRRLRRLNALSVCVRWRDNRTGNRRLCRPVASPLGIASPVVPRVERDRGSAAAQLATTRRKGEMQVRTRPDASRLRTPASLGSDPFKRAIHLQRPTPLTPLAPEVPGIPRDAPAAPSLAPARLATRAPSPVPGSHPPSPPPRPIPLLAP